MTFYFKKIVFYIRYRKFGSVFLIISESKPLNKKNINYMYLKKERKKNNKCLPTYPLVFKKEKTKDTL